MKTKHKFIFIILIVLITRIPFLNNGFGAEPDAWRVVSAARYIANTGEYVASRLPGYPIVELAYALLNNQSPFILNGISALFNSLIAGLFFLISTHYNIRRPFLLALTLALIPVVFIASTITMDYVWALFFLCFSWYMGLKRLPLISGILIALATGCRITSLIMVIPFTLMFLEEKKLDKKSFLPLLTFWSSAIIGSIIIFLPVLFRYGIKFFTYSNGGASSFLFIIKTALLDTWGIIGSVSIVGMVILLSFSLKNNLKEILAQKIADKHIMWSLSIIIVAIEFALLPAEAAYLIPAIPFLLLFIASVISNRFLLIGCILLCSSSFFFNIDSIDRPWNSQASSLSISINLKNRLLSIELVGPLIHDYYKRASYLKFITEVIQTVEAKEYPCVVVAGNWLPYVVQLTEGAKPETELADYVLSRKNAKYVSLLTPEILKCCQRSNLPIFFIPSVNIYNKEVYGIDLIEAGAKEIDLSSPNS